MQVLTDIVLVLSDEELHGALWAKHGSTLPLALLHLAGLWPRLCNDELWPCVEAGYADPGSPARARGIAPKPHSSGTGTERMVTRWGEKTGHFMVTSGLDLLGNVVHANPSRRP